MSTYRDIKTSRGLIWSGIALGYGASVAIAIINLRTEDGTWWSAIAFLAMLSVPSTMAVISFDRRPSLLTAAGMAALFQGLFLLTSVVGLVYIVVAILWYLANQRRPRPAIAPNWAAVVRPILGLAAVLPLLVMNLHLDPVCTSIDSQGTKTIEATTEFPSGWRFFQAGGILGTVSTSYDGSAKTCSSDIVRPWEAMLSITVSAGLLGLISLWPSTTAIEPRKDENVSVDGQ